jgi:hypothetical protein
MINHQIHFGRKFYQDKSTGYWISTDHPRIRAHQWVWINHHSIIPKEYHIHHRDENKSNNTIENLELIHKSRHIKLHMSNLSPEKRKMLQENCERIRPLTKAWHASEEGLEWHRKHAEKCKFGKWEARSYICEVCSKVFESTKRSNTKFCTNACKSQYRRDSGIDNVSRICIGCKKEYFVNKYSKQKYCSKGCRYA